jgi:uncharacterized protein YecE (DUF72 family)
MRRRVRLRVGTSGFAYKEWKGSFYPPQIKPAGMLRYYAERLPSVEINNTFYRMPEPPLFERWAGEVPEDFRFALKAPQRITHIKRLQESSAADVARFLEVASTLGERLGPLLFQLPPTLKKDVTRLRAFLRLLPDGCRAAFEFRHASWSDDEVLAALRERGMALCIADVDEEPAPTITATASWGYLRLRRQSYSEADLLAWAERVRQQPWQEAYVFFKHEDAGVGPALAHALVRVLGWCIRSVDKPRRDP